MDPALQQLVSEGLPDDEVELIIKLKNPREVPNGVTIISQFGSIATVRMRRANILPVYDSDEIDSMKAARVFDSSFYVAEEDSEFDGQILETDLNRRKHHWPTGKEVAVGVIDWGMDFAHPNFRNPDGTTRLLYLWDQSHVDASKAPQPYGYGRLYSQQEINEALATAAPYDQLQYPACKGDQQFPFHGTHVMDIAAGNGRVGPSGVAPEAQLIFVHLAAKTRPGINLGDSVRILEAIDFISKAAGSLPLVINTSIGTHGGNHLGNSPVEQGIDAFLEEQANRILCQSTGNYYMAKAHASGTVRPGRSCSVRFFVDQADTTPNELEIWYSGKDNFSLSLQHSAMEAVFYSRLDENSAIRINNELVGMIYHRSCEPNSGLNHIDIFLYKTAPPGAWKFTLQGETVVDGRFHAWIERDNGCKMCQATFDPEHVDTATTIGIICNGYNTITVGAYDPHAPSFTLAPFSSKGPTADGRVKPDLVAAGKNILAARSTPCSQRQGQGLLVRMSGTSMAAPSATGCCALMLEKIQKPVSIHTIRNLLLAATDEVEVSREDSMRVGSGVLNIGRALELVAEYNAQLSKQNDRVEQAATLPEPAHIAVTQEVPYLEEVIGDLQNSSSSPSASYCPVELAFQQLLSPYPGANISLDSAFKALQTSEGRISAYLKKHFEVIALPGQILSAPLTAEDLLLKHLPQSKNTCFTGLERVFREQQAHLEGKPDHLKNSSAPQALRLPHPVRIEENLMVLRRKT